MGERFLIVNADDFGMSPGINEGIVRCHRAGIVTSASLMVKRPYASQAVAAAATVPRLGVGLHIDLTEWEPVDGEWTQRYARVDVNDRAAVEREISHQVDLFSRMLGRAPDHLDSHQHVHLEGVVREVSIAAAREAGVPLRGLDARVAFCGSFYGQQDRGALYPEGITAGNLVRLVDAMADGWTELMCHPGLARDLDSVYAAERETELETLCAPGLKGELSRRGVALRSFGDLPSFL